MPGRRDVLDGEAERLEEGDVHGRDAAGDAAAGQRAELAGDVLFVERAFRRPLGIEQKKVWHFRQADGTVLSRWTGGVSLYVDGLWTIDEVVFGEPGDLTLLGARSLEGLNVRVDPVRKMLVDAGPAPAAAV